MCWAQRGDSRHMGLDGIWGPGETRRWHLVRAGDPEGQCHGGQRSHRSHGLGDPVHRGRPVPNQTDGSQIGQQPTRASGSPFCSFSLGLGSSCRGRGRPLHGPVCWVPPGDAGARPALGAWRQPRGIALQLSQDWRFPLASHGEVPTWRTRPGGRELLVEPRALGKAGGGEG